MTDKEHTVPWRLEADHLGRLIAMKRLAGKSTPDILRDLEQIARLNGKFVVITNKGATRC